MNASNYTRAEEVRIVSALRAGETPHCPRCGRPFANHPVAPTEGVPYVRDRVWLTCTGCRRSLVLDRRRLREER